MRVIHLHDPAITLLLFFAAGADTAQEAQALCDQWQHGKLALNPQGTTPHHYTGYSASGLTCELTCHFAYDTHILRLTCSRPGLQASNEWQEQDTLLQEITTECIEDTRLLCPWGITWLYHAVVPAQTGSNQLKQQLANTFSTPIDHIPLDESKYGWLTLLNEERKAPSVQPASQRTYLKRNLVFLTTQSRRQKVEETFLHPTRAGLTPIELYLHKGSHHLQQYHLLHRTMEQTRQTIEKETLQTLDTFDKSHQSQEKLDEIAKLLMKFLAYKGQAEVLLNSLRSNRDALREKLIDAQLIKETSADFTGSALYLNQLAIFQRGIEQIKNNLIYATTTQEMAQTIKELQRSVASAHQERINYLVSMIAALLTSVTVFNSFLDIWSLLLEGSKLELPAPSIRLMLSVSAAITSLLAIFLLIKQKTGWSWFFLILFAIICLSAYPVTMQWGLSDLLPDFLCSPYLLPDATINFCPHPTLQE